MTRSLVVKLLLVLTLPTVIILQQALPSKADGKGCVYYANGERRIAQDGITVRFSDGLNKCVDGEWVVIGD